MESLKRSRRIQDKEDKEAKEAEELALLKRVKLEISTDPGGASNCFADQGGSNATAFSSFAAKSSSSSQPRRVYGSKPAQAKAKCKTEGKGEHTD
jgi:hypothetical protein